MKVTVYSREAVETIIRNKTFPPNTAVISFYDPPDTAPVGYRAVDYPNTVEDVIYAAIPDLDWDSFEDRPDEMKAFFSEADKIADFIISIYQKGMDLICQCDYGQSRSAGCAMAVLEYFYHSGNKIFEDASYFPNQLIFGKLLSALSKKTRN